MQPSRRAFLLGRAATVVTPWQQFCLRLARVCPGRVVQSGANTARLTPRDTDDVACACALCGQYGVWLALAGQGAVTPPDPLVLWLDPAVALTGLAPLAGAAGLWRAEAGVRLADLQAAGLTQCAGTSADMTLAAWLAGPASGLCATGCTQNVGLVSLDVLLADGSRATLGAFGEHATVPLRAATVQRLVPRLFELARSADADACLAQSRWPARARLDALRSEEVNLAHLLLGHGGALLWVEAAVLSALPGQHPVPAVAGPLPAAVTQAAARLDAAVKALFDPSGRWGLLPASRP